MDDINIQGKVDDPDTPKESKPDGGDKEQKKGAEIAAREVPAQKPEPKSSDDLLPLEKQIREGLEEHFARQGRNEDARPGIHITTHIHGDIKGSIATGSGDITEGFQKFARPDSQPPNLTQEKELRLAVVPLSEDELRETKKTFVHAVKHGELEKAVTQHIVFIAGEEHSGKFAAAVYLAAQKLEEKKIEQVLMLPDRLDVSLDVITDRFSRPAVFLMRDACAVSNSLILRTIRNNAATAIPYLQGALGFSYLFVTVSNLNLHRLNRELLKSFSNEQILVNYTAPDSVQVLKRHIEVRLESVQANLLWEKCGDYLEAQARFLGHPRRVAKLVENILRLLDLSLPAEALQTQIEKGLDSILSIENEIEFFFEPLSEQEKRLAFDLSLLEKWPESDFWRLSEQLKVPLPENVEQNKKGKKKQRGNSWFDEVPKSKLLRTIRARTVASPVYIEGQSHLIQHIEFNDELYPEAIRKHVKKNYPSFLDKTIQHLIHLVSQSHDNFYLRVAVTQAIGLISRANWPEVEKVVQEWARDDAAYVRAMAARILVNAYKDDETRIYAVHLWARWSRSGTAKHKWAAASVYKDLRHTNLKLSLDGLELMAYRLDLSPLVTLLSFESIANWEEFFHNVGVTTNTKLQIETLMAEVYKYLDKIAAAKEKWEQNKLVYDAVCYAMIVIAFEYLAETICILCDWVNEPTRSVDGTIQLVGSLITLNVIHELNRMGNKSGTYSIMELISVDEQSRDAFAELLSGSLVELHKIQQGEKRWSYAICLLLEEWAKVEKYVEVTSLLVRQMYVYLSNHPGILRYLQQFVERRWQSRKAPQELKMVAKGILQKER